MSKDGELVKKRLQCKYHRQKVKEKLDYILKDGRISKELYNKCINYIRNI